MNKKKVTTQRPAQDTPALAGCRLLVVEDDPVARQLIGIWLKQKGYFPHLSPDIDMAMRLLQEQAFDIVLTDLHLGLEDQQGQGLGLIQAARDRPQPPDCVLMTAYGDQQAFSLAVQIGVDRILIKPFRRIELWNCLEQIEQARQTRHALALAQQALEAQNRRLVDMREREQSMARLAQQYLLTAPPSRTLSEVEWATSLQAADGASGDLLDISIHEQGIDFLLGDVMGKGLGTAIVSAGIKTALVDVRAAHPAQPMPILLERLMDRITPLLQDTQSLITLQMVRLDPVGQTLWLADFGAPRLMVLRHADGHVVFAQGRMMPIGIVREPVLALRLPIYPGDRVLMISDGVLDALGIQNADDAYAQLARELSQSPQALREQLERLTGAEVTDHGLLDDRSGILLRMADNLTPCGDVAMARFEPAIQSVQRMRDWVQGQWASLCPASVLSRQPDLPHLLLLGLSEIMNNIILHGQPRAGTPLVLQVDARPEGLWFEWHYFGRSYQHPHEGPARLPQPQEMRESSYGLGIADQVFDAVHYFASMGFSQTIVAFKAA